MDFAVIISSFLSGLLGSMGFGGGSVLIIYLTTFLSMPQKQAQGINLVFFIPIALLSVIIYSKEKLLTKEQIIPVMIPAIFGAFIGFFLLRLIPGEAAGKMFGALLILMGARQLLSRQK